jgi:ubiquinone/menaquinone biosynthesis C-methylase UbiE
VGTADGTADPRREASRPPADLAERAQIGAGLRGVDLCCCNGAGMRFLVRFRGVAAMTGVDATEAVIERGKERCRAEGVSEQVRFVHGDACTTGLPDGAADLVWGEDGWCYVFDKVRLISEVRVVKSGGTIAFTDWISGTVAMSAEESGRSRRLRATRAAQCVSPIHRTSLCRVQKGRRRRRRKLVVAFFTFRAKDRLTK